jgi:hypothetical protein
MARFEHLGTVRTTDGVRRLLIGGELLDRRLRQPPGHPSQHNRIWRRPGTARCNT